MFATTFEGVQKLKQTHHRDVMKREGWYGISCTFEGLLTNTSGALFPRWGLTVWEGSVSRSRPWRRWWCSRYFTQKSLRSSRFSLRGLEVPTQHEQHPRLSITHIDVFICPNKLHGFGLGYILYASSEIWDFSVSKILDVLRVISFETLGRLYSFHVFIFQAVFEIK